MRQCGHAGQIVFFCNSRKIMTGKKRLFGQNLQLTKIPIGIKNGQYVFSWFGDYHCYSFFSYIWYIDQVLVLKSFAIIDQILVLKSFAIIDQILVLKSFYFSKHERIIKHASWGKAVKLGAHCDIMLTYAV